MIDFDRSSLMSNAATMYDTCLELEKMMITFEKWKIYPILLQKMKQKRDSVIMAIQRHFRVSFTSDSLTIPMSMMKISTLELWNALEAEKGTVPILDRIKTGLNSLIEQLFTPEMTVRFLYDEKNLVLKLHEKSVPFLEKLQVLEKIFFSLHDKMHGFDQISSALYKNACERVMSFVLTDPDVSMQQLTEFHQITSKFLEYPENPFESFISNIESLKLRKAGEEIVEMARDLLIQGDYTMTECKAMFTKESLYYFPSCKIRRDISDLLHVLSDYVEKKGDSECIATTLRLILHYCPKKEDPALSCVLINDFMYVAHHLFMWQEQNSELYVPFFKKCRERANFFLLNMIQLSSLEILETFGKHGGFDGIFVLSNHSTLVKQFNVCITKWLLSYSSLPSDMMYHTIGKVFEALFDYIIKHVLQLKDIGAEESEIISSFMNSVMKLVAIFPDVDTFVPNFGSYSSIIVLLDIKLKEIIESIKTKRIRGLSNEQIRHVILSLFEESKTRSEVLEALESL